jgi:hypothetical protein
VCWARGTGASGCRPRWSWCSAVGEGTIEQVVDDLDQLRLLGADTVVLDPYGGDPAETLHPQTAWRALATAADHWDLNPHDERSDGDA